MTPTGRPTEPRTDPIAQRAMTTAGLQAKVTLRRVWFEAHPNQPMPEGREEVERLFSAIEAAAAPSLAPHDSLDEAWRALERLERKSRKFVTGTFQRVDENVLRMELDDVRAMLDRRAQALTGETPK